MNPAVAYLRVSGTSQLTGTGFDRQQIACESYANIHSLQLVQLFREEAVSGTLDEDQRPAFQAMIAHMLDSGIKVLLIERLDRLARMLQVQQQLILYIASKGLTLISADTGEDITEAVMGDPMKKAMVQIQGVFAELDKSMIVAKLKKGRERVKATRGRCEGGKPYGHYPGEAPVLARILAMRDAGMYHHEIAAALSSEGLLARSGKPWNKGSIAQIVNRERSQDRSDTALRPNCADQPLFAAF